MLEIVLNALSVIFQPVNFFLMTVGVTAGILVGAMPGLTATLAISLLLPFTFSMKPVPALIMLLGIYCGGMYGGAITAILVRAPGTPGAAATVFDGYPLTRKGQGGKAVGVATIASALGGLISATIMIILSPQISRAALRFGPPEFFALAIFGLSVIFSVSGKSVLKGTIAGIIGLLFATVGLDYIVPRPRFTFGSVNLLMGTPLLPVVIGLFAVAEVFRMIELGAGRLAVQTTEGMKIGRVIPSWSEMKGLWKTIGKSGLIGTFIGALPGAGANIAAFVAYGEAKRSSKNPEAFGTGTLEGVAAPEAANNAVTGGALIPLLTLGIPGDAVTAVLLGALLIQGFQPGPLFFRTSLDVIYPIFAGLILANLVMLVVGLGACRVAAKIATMQRSILLPVIAVFSIIGAFATQSCYFQMRMALVFGVIGYLMERYKFPVAPVALAVILGPLAETSFRQSLIMSRGNPWVFFTRPISLILLIIAAGSVVWAVWRARRDTV